MSKERGSLRRAIMADAGAMAAFMADLLAEKLDTISQRPPPTVEDECRFITEVEKSERAFILVASVQDAIVGMLDLRAGEQPSNQHVARFGMSVARPWRGCGVGRRLLTTAIEQAKAWPDMCRIELECVVWNAPAIRLYESLGFVVEARKRKAINFRGMPEDELLMAFVWRPGRLAPHVSGPRAGLH